MPLKPSPNSQGPALAVHSGALGDFILFLALIQGLRALGYGPVHAWARRAGGAPAAAHGAVDGFTPIDESPELRGLFTGAGNPAEPAIVRLQSSRIVMVSTAGGADSPLARRLRGLTGGPVAAFDPRPNPGDGRHVTDQWRERAAELGLKLPPRNPVLSVSSAAARAAWAGFGSEPGVLIHPGSGGGLKNWPLDGFLEVARTLAESGANPWWVLGPVEWETWRPDRLDTMRKIAPVAPPVDGVELASLSAGSKLYIGNDAGSTHLAAAAGAPVIGIFGPTDPAVWGPRGSRVDCQGGRGTFPEAAGVLNTASGVLE